MLKVAPDPEARILHHRFEPPDDLAPWVEHYWTVAWDFAGLAPHPVASLPHPSVHMVFEADGRGGVAGPARARFTRLLEGRGDVFAVKFVPGGFRAFSTGPISRLADRVEPLATQFGEPGARLEEGVLAASETAVRVRLVEDFLRARQPEPDPRAVRTAELVARTAREPGIVKVADLADGAGLSPRSLQRLFAEYVGVGPKWVIQRYRLHEAAERLAAGPVDQASLACEIGYSDQAHFIRDFKAMVGMTPAAYAQHAGHGTPPSETAPRDSSSSRFRL